jgi:asparagine synthase (glutamine-hydrolysing)
LKAFSKVRGVTFETDPLEITFGHLFPSALPNTILSKVSKILPGQLMRVRQESLDVSYKRWWILQDEIMHSLDNTRVRIDSLDSILESAVELRMRSDVPLAFSLSSGVDSTLLISQAAKMGYSAITAFSQGTSDLQDESVLASKTARALGIELKVTNLENYFSLELLLQSIYALEGSQSLGVGVLAHYKEIYNSGFKVVIEGHGGDELFGGYESHYRRIALHKILRLRPGAWLKARKMASALNGNQDSSITFIFRHHLLEDLIESLTNELNKARNSERIRKEIDYRLRSFGLDSKYNPLSYGALQRKIGFENYLLLQDFSYSTLPKILENFDKLSMSQSLEVRSPFLDWRFVLASFLIPGNEKFLNGGSKQILRDLMQPRVPIEVRNNRRKLGFTGHPTWLLTSQVQELILDYSRSRTFLDSPYWKGQEISSNIETSLKQGKGVEIMKYWGKIQLAIFMEAFAGEKF